MSTPTAEKYLPASFIEAATSTVNVELLSLDEVAKAMRKIEAVNNFFVSLHEGMENTPDDDARFVDQALDRWNALATRFDALVGIEEACRSEDLVCA